MCLVGPSEACDNYVADEAWMERSGNVCWGMGAMNSVPCVNCRQIYSYHVFGMYLEDDEFWLDVYEG